jgi:hypothetical protein
VTADRALHLMLTQERLELLGYQFSFSPPLSVGGRWSVAVYHCELDGLSHRVAFQSVLRTDALAQALHFCLMTEGTNAKRDTVPAPPAEEHAAE